MTLSKCHVLVTRLKLQAQQKFKEHVSQTLTCIPEYSEFERERPSCRMSQRTAERVEELRHRVGESETSSVTSSARSYGEGSLKARSADLSYRTYKT